MTTMTASLHTNHHSNDMISALADGQLEGKSLNAALQALGHDQNAVASWERYHLIGDVLRAPASGSAPMRLTVGSLQFVERFNQRLTETAALTPGDVSLDDSANPLVTAANDSRFRWKLAAGFATLAAVSVIAWTTLAQRGAAPAAQLALQSPPALAQVLVALPQGIMVRDARLNEMLTAHRQLGAGSALQAPSGFLQSAAFETTPASER